jgi:uncharacterized protein YqgQ
VGSYRTDGLFGVTTAALFFGRSAQWIHHHETRGNFVHADNTPIEPYREPIEKNGIIFALGKRLYDFDLIEAMADSLKRKRIISKYRHERTINAVIAMRKVADQ